LISKALSSQLEAILDDEQKQLNVDPTNNETGGAGGTAFWNNDETYEDYFNEGRNAWNSAVHGVVIVLSRFVSPCPRVVVVVEKPD
jgi:hypothetical protein